MKEWIWAVLLAVVLIGLLVFVDYDARKTATKEFEKDLVYCLAKKTACNVGIFQLYTIRTGETIIQIKTTNYNIAGAGDDTKQGGKK